jgi:heptosyltransferase II
MTGNSRQTVVYGAFKGMGDLLCAAPAITWELNQGSSVVLLVFPQMPREFLELIDFGPNRAALRISVLPTPARLGNMRRFFAEMSRLTPAFVWLSPHSPAPAASWRIPLLLAIVKRLYWPAAVLGGAESEPLSRFFDVRVPVDRGLPFAEREWAGYSSLRKSADGSPPRVALRESIMGSRSEPPIYDLLIHPGAGALNRRWPLEHFSKLVALIPGHYRIGVVALPHDAAAMKRVLPADRPIHFCSGSLEEAIRAMGRSRVALTMDSGPMFFSRALGVPTVSLFGASDPANVIGYTSPIVPLYNRSCPCQPCASARCSQKSVICMESIEPAAVAATVLDLLRLSYSAEGSIPKAAMRAMPAE